MVIVETVALLGRSFAATTTEGLLVYSLDHNTVFDPFELDTTVTPDRVRQAVGDHEYLTAVMLAFRLNERPLICHAVEHVPPADSTYRQHMSCALRQRLFHQARTPLG